MVICCQWREYRIDIEITNLQDQTNSLYHSAQSGFFNEVSFVKVTGERRLPYLAWKLMSSLLTMMADLLCLLPTVT